MVPHMTFRFYNIVRNVDFFFIGVPFVFIYHSICVNVDLDFFSVQNTNKIAQETQRHYNKTLHFSQITSIKRLMTDNWLERLRDI